MQQRLLEEHGISNGRTRSRRAPRRARREPGAARAAASGVPAARKKASLVASRPMAQSPHSTSASDARGGALQHPAPFQAQLHTVLSDRQAAGGVSM